MSFMLLKSYLFQSILIAKKNFEEIIAYSWLWFSFPKDRERKQKDNFVICFFQKSTVNIISKRILMFVSSLINSIRKKRKQVCIQHVWLGLPTEKKQTSMIGFSRIEGSWVEPLKKNENKFEMQIFYYWWS